MVSLLMRHELGQTPVLHQAAATHVASAVSLLFGEHVAGTTTPPHKLVHA
jgi:hypothetical protein